MKVIHFSDAHIDFGANMGKLDPITHLSSRVMDCIDMVDSVIDFAEIEKADLIIFAGDVFHRYNPNPIYTTAFADRVNRMLNLCPVVLLVGNHDMSPATSAVEIYDKLQLQDLYIGNDYQVHRIETKSGIIQVATAPYPSKRTLGKFTKEALNDKLYHLGDTITAEEPAILVGHFTVSGSKYGAEREYIFGDDASVDLEMLVDGTWDYVALGHIHFHQCLNEDPPVVYAGSVDRVTFGEEHDDKGFVLVDITNEGTKWEFITLDARPYKTVEIKTLKSDPMPKILAKIQAMDLTRAVVKLNIHVKEEYVSRVNQTAILELLDTKDLCMVTSLVIYPIRSELPTDRLDEMNITMDMSHREMLLNYMHGTGIDKSERIALMKMAFEIMQKVEVENVDSK